MLSNFYFFKNNFGRETPMTFNLALCCQLKDFNTNFHLIRNSYYQMQYSYETNMDAVYAEWFALSTCVSGVFVMALNKKLLSQTTNCGIIIAKGLMPF